MRGLCDNARRISEFDVHSTLPVIASRIAAWRSSVLQQRHLHEQALDCHAACGSSQ
jgi:hypothetical protein